ncbi:hypothetical protein GS399_20510 [Pedobacter sp. HMF7647]|uniref:Uncharacterized protein n=1 Tax=Hufsiella arboris TaxID=2695275 RepID=A0A7K1YH15_9SPHI|nr:hypothetical protein [Hufsiella arboris]
MAVHYGKAEIDNEKVTIDLTKRNLQFYLNDLKSYKKVNYKNGPVLYLKSNTKKIRIEANNNFCDSTDFKIFMEDLVNLLDLNKNAS